MKLISLYNSLPESDRDEELTARLAKLKPQLSNVVQQVIAIEFKDV